MENLFSQKYAKERGEDEVLAQAPIPVKLGKKDFGIMPLTIKKSTEWRKKMAEMLNELATGAFAGAVNPQAFMQGITVAFFSLPEKVLGLLVLYSPDVLEPEREWLEDKATDEEIVVAFSRIMVVAYPYFSLLDTMKTAATVTNRATSRQ